MILTNVKQSFITTWIEANQGALEEPVLNNGGTLMHVAVRQGQPKIAKALIENSNTMNSQDEEGNTALHYAYMFGFSECIQLLTEFEADELIKNR